MLMFYNVLDILPFENTDNPNGEYCQGYDNCYHNYKDQN